LKKTDVKGNFYPKINKFVTRGLPHFKKLKDLLSAPATDNGEAVPTPKENDEKNARQYPPLPR